MSKVTAHITTTDNPEGYDYTHEQPDIPTFVNLYPDNIPYCPIHKTQYISDNCVICTKDGEKK